ncbi:flavin reductase family protein [Halomonas sp. MCCC 1A11036]|uniref:Flavin reductase family protein n=1 Tax=Billgrantia zhangzhouensis TaxID=2733481 RepID=A0ABS9AJJ7_9GAMM|nr:flavin reductase family protein [Halomonas zhangzhouensis]MCE8021965.1 flavin reductase family protein [Halomonas zhangzhouensis]
MFYEPQAGHGLPHDPFKAIVAPRPIGWISTMDEEGRLNLAPYSFFNALSSRPPMVGFSSEGMKDTPRNARATREFVFNLATLPLARAMNDSAAALPPGESEFEFAGLEFAPSGKVRPPRVAGSPAALECRVVDCLELRDLEGRELDRHLIVGQVVGVHIDDAFLREGRFDTVAAQTLARCGYRDYAAVREVFELLRPGE